MSVLPIVQFTPSELRGTNIPLRKVASSVAQFDSNTQQIITDIIDTMFAHKIAIGLAAPQLGIDLQIAAVNLTRDPADTLVLCNPVVVSTSGKKDKKRESCMSIPGYAGAVERREKISITYQNPRGEVLTLNASGFLARAIAHEIDHLQGALYIDRMSSAERLQKTDLFEKD